MPNHPDAVAWLEEYHRQQQRWPYAQLCSDAGDEAGAGSAQSSGGKKAKAALILAPVGDRWDPIGVNKCALETQAVRKA